MYILTTTIYYDDKSIIDTFEQSNELRINEHNFYDFCHIDTP